MHMDIAPNVRSEERDEILKKLSHHKVVVLIGFSGVGKSSFAKETLKKVDGVHSLFIQIAGEFGTNPHDYLKPEKRVKDIHEKIIDDLIRLNSDLNFAEDWQNCSLEEFKSDILLELKKDPNFNILDRIYKQDTDEGIDKRLVILDEIFSLNDDSYVIEYLDYYIKHSNHFKVLINCHPNYLLILRELLKKVPSMKGKTFSQMTLKPFSMKDLLLIKDHFKIPVSPKQIMDLTGGFGSLIVNTNNRPTNWKKVNPRVI